MRPLALAGWLAHRRGSMGVLARLVVPAGAIAEPFVARRFVHPYLQIPWPERWSDTTSDIVLIILGITGAALVLWENGPTATRR